MNFVLEGLLFGLTLTILLGPIFVALTQTAIEKGARAGFAVGMGVWTSDFIIIFLCFFFVNAITPYFQDSSTKLVIGLIGGFLLIGIGMGSFFTKISLASEGKAYSFKNYSGFVLKGFLVNTVNPFTFIFWTTTISQYIIGRGVSNKDALVFLTSIMITIIVTDIMKVVLAKMIRSKLREHQLQWFTRIAGLGLCVFGLVLIFKCIPQ